jgi:hypothetical protein
MSCFGSRLGGCVEAVCAQAVASPGLPLILVAMPHLRIVGAQAGDWASARNAAGHNVHFDEARWREGMTVKQEGHIARVSVHLASSRMTCEGAELWCAWFENQRSMLEKRGGATVALEKVDFSRNEIGDHGLSALTNNVFVDLVPKVIMLFGNAISDTSPLERVIEKGVLRELHLSDNQVTATAACQLVVAAASARDMHGDARYPVRGETPLWLRLENNTTGANAKFNVKLAETLCHAGRPLWRAVCFVNGKTWCTPSQCSCLNHAPAVHLTYMGTDSARRRQWRQPTRGGPSRGPSSHTHPSPPKGAGEPTVAPWRHVRHEHSDAAIPAVDVVEYPPLPTNRPPTTKLAFTTHNERVRATERPVEEKPGVDDAMDLGTHLPLHVAACDYDAETPYCMTVRVGDVVLVPESTFDMFPGYKFAIHSLTLEYGWISAAAV